MVIGWRTEGMCSQRSFLSQASIKRRRKGGRPRGTPPPPADTMTAAELSSTPGLTPITGTTATNATAPDVNHNLTVVTATHNGHRANNINNNINKRSRDDNNRFNG